MTTRSLVPVLLAGVVSAASGCHWFHRCFPCLSWRLHHWHYHHAPAVYADPVYAVPACPGPGYCPVPVYRPVGLSPMVPLAPQGDCPECGPDGVNGPAPTVPSPPPLGYAPLIGQPMPLPMPKVVPSDRGPSGEGKTGGN